MLYQLLFPLHTHPGLHLFNVLRYVSTRIILAMFDGLATHRILTKDDAAARRALKVAARAGLFTRRGGDA